MAPTPGSQAVLFSGHMIDRQDRANPRFPIEKVPAAANRIACAVDDLEPAADDLAVSGAACGGDLLFADTWLSRGCRLEVVLPRPTPEFLAESVRFAGAEWEERFEWVVKHPKVRVEVLPSGTEQPHQQAARRMLEVAVTVPDRVLVGVFLWDRRTGDGPGGTAALVDAVSDAGGRVVVIDPADLDSAAP